MSCWTGYIGGSYLCNAVQQVIVQQGIYAALSTLGILVALGLACMLGGPVVTGSCADGDKFREY